MKRLIAFIMAAAMLVSLTTLAGCADGINSPAPDPTATDDPIEPTPDPTATEEPTEPTPDPTATDEPTEPTPTPAATEEPTEPTPTPTTTEEPTEPTPAPAVDAMSAASAMLPVLSSLLCTMEPSLYGNYDRFNYATIGRTLAQLTVEYGADIEGVICIGDRAFVPAETFLELTGIMFDGVAAPPNSSYWPSIIEYDDLKKGYYLSRWESPEVNTVIHTATILDGVLTVNCTYTTEDGSKDVTFDMLDNEGGLFPYRVNCITFYDPFPRTEFCGSIERDIDGDGMKDIISISKDDSSWYLTVNDIETTIGRVFHAYAYICDIDTNDGRLNIVINIDIGANYYIDTDVIDYSRGRVNVAGKFGTLVDMDGKGNISVRALIDVFGTYYATAVFNYSAGSTELELVGDVYRIDHSGSEFDDRALTTVRDALPVTLANGKAATLPVGTRLLVMSTDGDSWADCMLEDGSMVRIAFTKEPEGYELFIDGINEYEWFDMLFYAG